jgi:hypothetical protein
MMWFHRGFGDNALLQPCYGKLLLKGLSPRAPENPKIRLSQLIFVPFVQELDDERTKRSVTASGSLILLDTSKLQVVLFVRQILHTSFTPPSLYSCSYSYSMKHSSKASQQQNLVSPQNPFIDCIKQKVIHCLLH